MTESTSNKPATVEVRIKAEERRRQLISFAQHKINWEQGSSHPDVVAMYEENLDKELAIISASRAELEEISSQIRSGQLQVKEQKQGE